LDNGIDCDTNILSLVGALQAAGYAFAGRYLGYSSKSDPLTLAEVKHCSAMNFPVFALWENGYPTTDNYFTQAQAALDANSLLAATAEIQQPTSAPVYVTVDYDARPNVVLPYFKVLHESRFHVDNQIPLGVYGSGAVCQALLEIGYVSFTYLAYSPEWSGHDAFLSSNLWNLWQTSNDTPLLGLSVDTVQSQGHGGGWLLPSIAQGGQ